MKRGDVNIGEMRGTLIATAVIMAAVLGYFFIFSEIPEIELGMNEGNIGEKVNFTLENGEMYSYFVNNSEAIGTVVLNSVEKKEGCRGHVLSCEASGYEVCVNRRGVEIDRYGREIGSELNYQGNDCLVMFSPWMLAVNETWEWEVEMTSEADIFGMPSKTSNMLLLRGRNAEMILGREAYVVEVVADGKRIQRIWVDREKRVLLYTEMESGNIELVSGPFEISTGSGIPESAPE